MFKRMRGRCGTLRDMIAKETMLAEVGEMLMHVVKHMATKEDVARLDARIDALGAKIDQSMSS
jgi:hypothetical protein